MNWKKVRHHHMGGTVALGFDASSKFLLVLSHQGSGVFEVATGKLKERNPNWSYEGYRDSEIDGSGLLEGQILFISGLHSEPKIEVKNELANFDIHNQITEFKGAVISPNKKYLAIGYSDLIEIYENTQQTKN